MVASAIASPKAPKAAKADKASTSHPPFAKMITEAIAALKERGGSSRQAILKYIKAHYRVDERVAEVNVRKVLVSATAAGKLVRVKGAGASGSFKLSEKAVSAEKKTSAPRKPKAVAAAATTAAAAASSSEAKKPAAAAAKPKKTAAAKPKKSPVKARKPVAPKTKKPAMKKAKTVKPKKPKVKKTPKRAAPAKK